MNAIYNRKPILNASVSSLSVNDGASTNRSSSVSLLASSLGHTSEAERRKEAFLAFVGVAGEEREKRLSRGAERLHHLLRAGFARHGRARHAMRPADNDRREHVRRHQNGDAVEHHVQRNLLHAERVAQ